jgi:membrane protease YdiL (CAAX protease family)
MYEPAPEIPYLPVRQPIVPIERLGALVEVAICSGFPTQLMLILVLTLSGLPMQTAAGRLSPPFIFALALGDAVLVIGLVLLLLVARHESPRRVLIGERRPLVEALIGLFVLPILLLVVGLAIAVLGKFAPWLHNVPTNPLEEMLQTRRDAVIFALVAMVAGGVREEIQRGFIVHRFEQYLGGGAVGVLLYSIVFGLGHYEQGFDAMITTGLLGLLWGAIYLARRSIVAPMVSHASFNLAQLIRYFVLVR